MTYTYNGWEGQTPGNNVNSTNNGASSGTALNIFSGTVPVYSTAQAAHGSTSILYSPVSGTASFVGHNVFGGLTLAEYIYVYLTALPTAATTFWQWRTAVGQACNATFTAAGVLNLQNSAGTAVSPGSFTVAVPILQWVRYEMTCFSDAAAGTASLAYFLGDSPTPVASTGLQTGLNTRGGNLTDTRYGKITASTFASAFHLDDTSGQDTSTQMPLLPGQKMPSLPTPRAALIRASTR